MAQVLRETISLAGSARLVQTMRTMAAMIENAPTKTSTGCSWACSQLVVPPATEGVGMSVHPVTRSWMDLSAAAAKELAMLATTSPATPLPTADATGQRPSVRYVTTTLQPAGIPAGVKAGAIRRSRAGW